MELITKRFSELTTDELYDILKARVDIFVVEQNCPYHEIDGADKYAYHMYLKEDGKLLAYLRIVEKDRYLDEIAIGRVITVKRGCGLGSKILGEGIKFAKEKLHAPKIKIEAQTYAKGFYEKHGFRQISDKYDVDGIEHIQMALSFGKDR